MADNTNKVTIDADWFAEGGGRMASESEKVADVVRELRTWGRVDVSVVGRDILRRDAERFADRIEAAHKREKGDDA